MNLKLSQISRAIVVLDRLSNRKKTTLVEGRAQTVDDPLSFDNASVYWTLAENEATLRDAHAAFAKRERALMATFMKNGSNPLDQKTPNTEWIIAQGELQEEELDVEITKIKASEFKFETNHISPSERAALAFMIDRSA